MILPFVSVDGEKTCVAEHEHEWKESEQRNFGEWQKGENTQNVEKNAFSLNDTKQPP